MRLSGYWTRRANNATSDGMSITVTPLAIPAVKRITLTHYGDMRGFFVERFNEKRFADAGLPSHFVQDNWSRSLPRVIRGIHYQYAPAQGKLVGCVRGKVWDVAVDLRPGSPTFGQHVGETLDGDDENASHMLWIPAGFGHGFCVLGEQPADLIYKTDAPYGPGGEGGIRYDDPELAIHWPVKHPVLSEKDRAMPSLQDYRASPPEWPALNKEVVA